MLAVKRELVAIPQNFVLTLALMGFLLLTLPASARNVVVNGEFDEGLNAWLTDDNVPEPSMTISIDSMS
jgi:hypothetical protein